MKTILHDYRRPVLLNPQGDPQLPASVLHDRRRKVVEHLLETLRQPAQVAALKQQQKATKNHAAARRLFWSIIAGIAFVLMLVTLITRRTDTPSRGIFFSQSQIASYKWVGFHRVTP